MGTPDESVKGTLPSSKPPVVGIGASAGGIEALQRFFAVVSNDLGVAFVVVVHLAPDRKSELPEILARKTDMPVIQVGDHDVAKLKPNHIYVIAPDRKLEITDTSVGASQFEEVRGKRAAIDLFFRSLASSHGDGFAVVLSGSGSDGALGARAVKEAGGLVLVQSPVEAAHDGMPRAVVATGTADVVAPVEELARRLSELVRNRGELAGLVRAAGQPPEIDEGSQSAFKSILEIVHRRTGHDFSKYKQSTILRRMARRMQLSHRTTISGYHGYLRDDAEEVQALFNDLLISVTTFFRDSDAWSALQKAVIGALIERADVDQPIRTWVPGCATGEEAYTLAILFQEEIDRREIAQEFIIFASDVDEGALAIAREGVYPSAISADVSEERLGRHFNVQGDHYRVSRELRDHLVFTLHSLLRDPPFSRLHLISCRNLLIYLNRELQEQVMALFQYACQEDAYLFLGVSEQADREIFEVVDKQHRIFKVKKAVQGDRASLPTLLATPRRGLPQERAPSAPPRSPALDVHVDALETVAPPSLVVDEGWNILHLSSTVARYLQQRGGPYARQVTDAVRSELRDEVHMVLHRAFDEPDSQLSPFVDVVFDGALRRVAVLAQRRKEGEEGRTHALLTFLEAGETENEESFEQHPDAGNDVVRGLQEKLRQVEGRLESMRDDRHLGNEDLRAANEELQSLNEEYRSTTEELETSKEELQSVNEELHTVNHELKAKLEEVSRAHDDLENLMAATNIPTLFLSKGLRITRFTPKFGEIFNVTSRDRGRLISSFTHILNYQALEQDAQAVLAQLTPIEREVQARDGRTFILRIAAYRTSDEKVDGIVVTLVDVTRLLKVEAESRERAERFRALVDASAQMVWAADREGRFEDSPSWRAFTGQTEKQWTESWLDAVHPDDRQLAADAWREAVETGSIFSTEFRVFHAASGLYRWTTVRAVPLSERDGTVRGWVGMHMDVSDRREAEEALRETDRRKDEFLAILGHELRNPLAAIRSSIAVQGLATKANEDRDRAWAIVDRQSRHMTRLVNDLLDIVRLDRGKLRLQRARVDMLDCIKDAANAVEPDCRAEGLTLGLDLPDEPLCVEGDAERIVQVLDNLLRNAVNHTDAGGDVTVAAVRTDERAVVSIRDSGVGMEPAEIERLFEPYQQVDPGHRSGGLGLGLTLVRRLVELHGGTVKARSDGVGKGSEFEIRLPLAAATSFHAPADGVEAPPRRRVLIVDDDIDVAETLASLLEALGQDVEVANTGLAGVEIARRRSPEVAFIDLSMPGMNGEELARCLRAEGFSSLFMIALSGFGIDSRKVSSDFDEHLRKPATVETIVGVLNAVKP